MRLEVANKNIKYNNNNNNNNKTIIIIIINRIEYNNII